MKKKQTKEVKIITDVKQMHKRPGRRCYIMSADGIPKYRLASEIHNDNKKWYGWIGLHIKTAATSIVNPFFPMSDTAKGAIKNELNQAWYVGPDWDRKEVPLVFYEFMNFEQAQKYFKNTLRRLA